MSKQSAGILVYRVQDNVLQVLLAHPGGPLWAKKDAGAWSIFKGEPDDGEALLDTARREFEEETGQSLPEKPLLPLGDFKRKDGKAVHAWALEADYEPSDIISNAFEMEWPPKSGKMQEFPENDRAVWFDAAAAPEKMFQGQHVFVERLTDSLRAQGADFTLQGRASQAGAQPTLF